MDFAVRQARQEDAAALVAYMQAITSETDIYIVSSPGEFRLTEADEKVFLQNMAAADNSVCLVAEAGGRIVGSLLLRGGERKAVHHSAELGITVARGWRNQGVGQALMQTAIEWARAGGVLKRIELRVFAANQPAIHLYEKFGFVEEGRRERAIFKYGRYYDDLIMRLLLEP